MPAHPVSRLMATTAALVLAVSLAACGDDEAGDEPAGQATSTPPSASESPAASTEPEPAGALLEITVSGADISPMAKQIDLTTGEALTVRITSDRAGELHVHSSPEQYVEFGAGRTSHKLTVDKPGQVDVEEHESGALVARLLVE